MKKFIFILFLFVSTYANDGYISIKKAFVLEKPNLFAKKVAELDYGEKVTLLEKKGAYYKIKFGHIQGWLHKSSFTSNKIVILGKTKKQASASEITAATKGFNEIVEKNYKLEHKELRFDLLDIGEKLAKIDNFIETGIVFRKNGKLCEFKKVGQK